MPRLARALLAATLVFAAILAASLRWHITMRNPGIARVEVSAGSIKLSWWTVPNTTNPGPVEWDAGPHTMPADWLPQRYRRSATTDGVLIPIYILVVPLAALTALLAWHTRRARPLGRCPHCAYDRSGLAPETPCPECGRTVT